MTRNDYTKKRIIDMIYQDISINNISKALNVAKSTIYYHYKKIKGRKYPLLYFQPAFSEQEGEIIGIFAGDGSLYFEPKSYSYYVNIHFCSKNIEYALYVKKLFENYFGKNFILTKPNNGTIKVYTK